MRKINSISGLIFLLVLIYGCTPAKKRFPWPLALTGIAQLKNASTSVTYNNGSNVTAFIGDDVSLNPPAHIDGSVYSIKPILPNGLTLNTATGVIAGRPTEVITITTYSVTQIKPDGTVSTYTFTITINGKLGNNNDITGAPVFSPASGHYSTPQSIALSTATSGANIYFTTDGTTPTEKSYLYSSPIHIWSIAGRTIKAVAVKSGLANSSVITEIYSYSPLKTGQTTSYATGDDANKNQGVERSFSGPSQHSIYTSDYTVTDNATGLVWKACSEGQTGLSCNGTATFLSWQDAQTVCNELNNGNGYSGRKNWRLPTKQELETALNFGYSNPAVNPTVFPSTTTYDYFSSTDYAPDTTLTWKTNFQDGYLGFALKLGTLNIRCVSSAVKKEYFNNFTDVGNGTVKDNATNLIWQKCSRGQNNDSVCSGTATTANWSTAVSYCNALNLASKEWRLPNFNELNSIVDTVTATAPSIYSSAFPSTMPGNYWSSTTVASNTNRAWSPVFQNGVSNPVDKPTTGLYVRCVSGQ